MRNTARTSIWMVALLAVWAELGFSQSPTWRALPNAPRTQNRMDDVYFVNPSLGWMVSNPDCSFECDSPTGVWKTTDGGASWELKFTASEYLRSVGFLDSLTGFVGTVFDDSRVLYQTTDGGATWSLVPAIPEPRPFGMCGISIVNDSVMYASGRFFGPPRVIKTTDRGTTWTAMDLSAHAGSLVDCYFYSPDSGFVVGSSNADYNIGFARVLFTANGGATWTTRYAGTRAGELCWKLNFRSKTIGYVSIESFSSGPTYYLKSTNGGTTWNDQLFQSTPYDVQGIGFVGDSLGWLGGWGGDTYETTNAGASWHLAGFGYILNRFRFLSDTLAYAVGQTVFKYSVDSVKAIWKAQAGGTTAALHGVSFADALSGIAVGEGGTILRTTDGGLTWTNPASGTFWDLHGVSFTDANTGTAVGMNGTILRTTNGGAGWSPQSSGTLVTLYGVSFTGANSGTAVGESGTILRTTNGGLNWMSQASGTTDHLRALTFTDVSNGTTVGSNGTILRTTNGGVSWTPHSSGTFEELRDVSFVNANTGTAVGSNGTILRTTNGGVGWTAQSSLMPGEINGVSFTDENAGLAVGQYGIILRTKDGGASWAALSSGTSDELFGVSLSDADTGTIVGFSGTILRTTTGGAGCPVALSGDANASGQITSADLIYLVNHIFKSGPEPLPIAESGDVNCDQILSVSDIIYLVNYTFKSGPEPCDVCSIL